MGAKKPFQLLEINIISGQDLEPVSKKMRTYAMAWMNPNRKLVSSVDVDGSNNPTWNDKFVFKVDDEFLQQDTSAVMIEIYSKHWFRDVLVGTVRVLIGNLIPSTSRNDTHIGVRFVALQVRRPSGRPQGILNVGVALLDSNMRGMQLYRQLSMSAVGCRDLIEDPPTFDNHFPSEPTLRRSRSERSRFDFSPGSSIIALPPPPPPAPKDAKENSILSIAETLVPIKGMKRNAGKASSVINVVQRSDNHRHPRKASSVVGGYPMHSESDRSVVTMQKESDVNSYVETLKPPPPPPSFVPRPMKGGDSVLSDSEVGPSPSEVAAAMMMAERRYPLNQDNESSVLDGWSLDESVEGLRSKLERWRMELPAVYDNGSFTSSSSYKSSSRYTRRSSSSSASDGKFSCFGNIFGYECQCICGQPTGKRTRSGRIQKSPSISTTGESFI